MKTPASFLILATCSLFTSRIFASELFLKSKNFHSRAGKKQYLTQLISEGTSEFYEDQEALFLSTPEALDCLRVGDLIQMTVVDTTRSYWLEPPVLMRAVSTYGYEAPAPSSKTLYRVTAITTGIPHSKGSGVYKNEINPPEIIRLLPADSEEDSEIMLFWYINRQTGKIEQFEDGAEIASIEAVEIF